MEIAGSIPHDGPGVFVSLPAKVVLGTSPGAYPLALSDVRASGARGEALPVRSLSGTLLVTQCLTGDVNLDGRVSMASDWSALTAQGLGWPLPVDGLAFWVQGAPRPGSAFSTEPDDGGRVALIRQDGWTIVYHAYTQVGIADWRPARMTLSYPDVELRIAVDSWRIVIRDIDVHRLPLG